MPDAALRCGFGGGAVFAIGKVTASPRGTLASVSGPVWVTPATINAQWCAFQGGRA